MMSRVWWIPFLLVAMESPPTFAWMLLSQRPAILSPRKQYEVGSCEAHDKKQKPFGTVLRVASSSQAANRTENMESLEEPYATSPTVEDDTTYMQEGLTPDLINLRRQAYQDRFGGIERLYRPSLLAQQQQKQEHEESTSPQATEPESADTSENTSGVLDRLRSSTVVVVGLGGVGSWAAEALCRSGVGHLILVDLDDVCLSNTNRQLHAMASTVGQFKIDVMAQRFRQITSLTRDSSTMGGESIARDVRGERKLESTVQIDCIYDFISADNVREFLRECQNMALKYKHRFHEDRHAAGGATATMESKDGIDTQSCEDVSAGPSVSNFVVLDAIDGTNDKVALLLTCADMGIPVVTCGGAAGKQSATQMVVRDLAQLSYDPLLKACRKQLRKQVASSSSSSGPLLPVGSQYTWKIPAVFSIEPSVRDWTVEVGDSNLRQCEGALGTACFVTGTLGFVAASHIVQGLVHQTLTPPNLFENPSAVNQ